MSQVVTLYKDKEKTNALYPRTKVSAISDDNNTSLQELLNRYEIIDNLTSYETDKALSANQGRELKTLVDDKADNTTVDNLQTTVNGKANLSHTHTKSEITDFDHTHDDRYYTESEIDTKVSELNNAITNISPLIAYPIGSVYFSVNDTNPSTILGGGTWELIGSKLAVRENVVGNGYGLAITNGNGNCNITVNDNFIFQPGYSSNFPKYAGDSHISGTTLPNTNKYIGAPTKAQLGEHPEYSGLIVDTETIYSWKRVA